MNDEGGTVIRRTPPANRTTRVERLKRWNDEFVSSKFYRPAAVSGKNARGTWLDEIWKSDLSPTVRHVAVVTVLAGNQDGTKIWPGLRWIEQRCGYSQRAISDALSHMVSHGWLKRTWRKTRSDGTGLSGAGFAYQLTIPQVRNADQQGCETGISTSDACETPFSTGAESHA
jgi:hypothetical protein